MGLCDRPPAWCQLPKGRVYPLSILENKAMEEYISEALQQGFIRSSTSPAASSFFFVAKKDGGLRPCIDYCVLNSQMRVQPHLHPLGRRVENNFITPSGHYEYLVMPYGLSNAPSVFQSFMNEIFRDMLHRFVVVYIDDNLIYSPNLSDHVDHVKQVLNRLRHYHLYLKLEKCEFHQSTTQFLGYVISPEGIQMDCAKVEAIKSWPQPGIVKDLQHFLGFANFYRRFISGYSDLTAPLTSLLHKKPKNLSCISGVIEAFRKLKAAFCMAPNLVHADPTRPFVVEVDASALGVGAVLSQRRGEAPVLHPCAYFSKKLSPVEQNYDIGNRELLAIKLALEEWRHWLEGANHPFEVITDYKNLQYLREAKRLNPRQARWALFFTQFNFCATYHPGNKNTKADALSRIHSPDPMPEEPEPILPPDLFVCPITWSLDDDIRAATEEEPAPPGGQGGKAYVPTSLRLSLLDSVHASPGSGYPGRQRTLSLLKERYWWPNMAEDVACFVRGCAMVSTSHHLPEGKLVPLPITHRPWSHLGIDFAKDLPVSNGFTTILVTVDRFSKACKLIPLKGLPTALEMAEALFSNIFRHFGIAEDIVSDRGPQFISRVWQGFFKLLGVSKVQADVRCCNAPLYHPGDKVWLSTRDIRLRLPCEKLNPRYIGPFTILRQINDVPYELQLPHQYHISPTFHVSLLKSFTDSVLPPPSVEPEVPPPPEIDTDDTIYQVREVVNSRRRGGRLQYLVDWEGYGPEERSLVERDDILDPSLLVEFHQCHPGRPAPRGHSRPRRRPHRSLFFQCLLFVRRFSSLFSPVCFVIKVHSALTCFLSVLLLGKV
ncbi:hypothetical protein QTP70_018584 [Hemibagrus guttatus]|uniref:Gypsy retrotransposon integrase-like protein 1 n=1 Tax=Hemibagrus guttatus TaxID=175788 RepID=A0AAE0QIM9_9TELE|nr:hypothetical protein QTP70_018584 [Hemibagrus guttatus]